MLDGVPPDTRVVIAGVSWEFYNRFSSAVRDGDNCRVAFDGTDIEMMTLGPLHERYKTRFDTFIAIVADERRIQYQPQGSTTWKRKKVKRGIEPDSCYYFDPEKLLACAAAEAIGSNSVKDYPNPDLAVEIDLSPSRIDRPGIYAALQIPELWRLRAGVVSIEKFAPPGVYVPAERSQFLFIRPEDVTRWIVGEDSRDQATWKFRLREWVRTELL
jgi:Uma2 family endonuclease